MFSFFKSLQWRLVFILISMTVVLMVFVAVYLNVSVESSSYDSFRKDMEEGLRNWDMKDDPSDAEVLKYLKDDKYARVLFPITVDETLTVYNSNTATVVYTWDKRYDTNLPQDAQRLQNEIETSPNYIRALRSGTGDIKKVTHLGKYSFFDYATLKGDQVLYFRYYSDAWAPIIGKFNNIIISGSLIAILISLVIGYILSKTITVPIAGIMNKARKIAAGDFDQILNVKSDDEIGKLTDTFNYMAGELKTKLNEISSEKNKVEIIQYYLTDGVIAFNIKGELIHINPAAKSMLGLDDFDLGFGDFCSKYNLNISFGDFIYLDCPTCNTENIEANDKIIRIEFAIFTDDVKKAEGIIAVLHDITEQERLEKMRREFVANVSHELKTPLTSIKSYTETLLDGALDDRETAESFLEVVNSEADRMSRLVRDLLQLSSLENRQIKWNKDNVRISDIVKNSIVKIQMEAKNKGQQLESYVIGDLPEIEADPDRLEQVILNILSNAIKYTPDGGKITVYMGKTYSEVYVKVADTGIGIPQNDLPRIFERFYRVDKARSREMGGTGLGLSIAKEITEAQGGTISINSEQGKGTEVVIKLPFRGIAV